MAKPRYLKGRTGALLQDLREAHAGHITVTQDGSLAKVEDLWGLTLRGSSACRRKSFRALRKWLNTPTKKVSP